MSSKRRAIVGVLAVVATFAAACGGSNSDSGGPGSGSSTPVEGGTLTIATAYDISTLDPRGLVLNGALDATQAGALYDTLIRVDEDGTIVPRLATAVESENFVTWTLKLREGLTFSDGTPFDAEAVKFNWDRLADPDHPSSGTSAALQIASSEVVDDVTLTFDLTSANARFPELLQDHLGTIGSPTAMEKSGDSFGAKPVGAGPFVLAERQQDVRTVYKANPDYWDAPKPYLDEIVYQVVADPTQRMNSLKAGEISAAFYSAPSGEIRKLKDEGFTSVNTDLVGGAGIILNTKVPGLDDVRVRRALSLALDPETVNQAAADGGASAVDGMFPKGSVFVNDAKPPVNNKDEAQQLIDEYTEETGKDLELDFLFNPQLNLYSQAIMQQWGELDGLKVKPVLKDSVTADIIGRTFEMATGSVSGPDPYSLWVVRAKTGGSQNYGGYSNAEVDAALDKAATSTDVKELAELYATVSERLFEDVPSIFLYRNPFYYFFTPAVRNASQYHYAALDVAEIWVDK